MARAGDILGGKYRLIHPLGIGGMGAVWRAEHRALKLQVAVKLLDARGPSADLSVARFQREAQIAASVRHRNIVYISDFGTDRGMPYLVMELLSGVPLSERLLVGEPLSVMSFLRYIAEILDGLHTVHAAGVVHRDMKPENIFLVRDGATVLPKLLDFGVSRSTERNTGHTITREGIVMGTPEYIAPEQARGKRADVRSDLYSVGVVIYEALAGRLPFQADNAADLIAAVLSAQPVPLSSLRPDLGEPLSQLVHTAMDRKPERRFQTAREMRAAIEAFLSAHPEVEHASLPRRHATTVGTRPSSARPPARPTPTQGEEQLDFAASEADLRLAGLGRRRWSPLAAAGLACVVLAVSIAMFTATKRPRAATRAPTTALVVSAAASERPSKVRVELLGLPAEGTVLLDGRAVPGPTLELERDSGPHSIEVRVKGSLPFRVTHDARADGRYALAFEPEPPAAKPPRRSRTDPQAPARDRPGKKASLVRTPDF